VPFILEVTQGECPLPPEGEFSPEFRNFVSLCLEQDPEDRPPAKALLNHAFILKHRADVANLASFVRASIPEAQKRMLEDAQLTGQPPPQ